VDNSEVLEDFNIESFEHSPTEKWLNTSKITPLIQLDIQSNNEEENSDSPTILQNMEKIYTITRRKEKLSNVLLPLSAASYYNGVSPEIEIVESCESVDMLNAYLKARKDDVSAGVPGKFLYAVLGSDDAGNSIFLNFHKIYVTLRFFSQFF
jgi:exopolyphosphatase